MTELEQQILDIIQDGFPIVERPYAALADMLNREAVLQHADDAQHLHTTEQLVFDVVESLRSSGVIRRLGGVYDTKRLGLVSRLCAGKVPSVATGATDDSALEQFAAAVMEIPAITHNYVRSHQYNVWFTVIAESELALQAVIDKLCGETALHDVHSMPARKMFKINTVMSRRSRTSAKQGEPSASAMNSVSSANALNVSALSVSDRTRIRLLSGDLPHSLTPFNELFADVISGTKSLADLLQDACSDLTSRRMRRFGAVLRHQDAGFPCNAMACFDVADGSAAGAVLAANPHVSHCYERPPFEGFPYNVYAMFHASTSEELLRFVNEAVAALGNPQFAVLHSVRELKKTSYKYF